MYRPSFGYLCRVLCPLSGNLRNTVERALLAGLSHFVSDRLRPFSDVRSAPFRSYIASEADVQSCRSHGADATSGRSRRITADRRGDVHGRGLLDPARRSLSNESGDCAQGGAAGFGAVRSKQRIESLCVTPYAMPNRCERRSTLDASATKSLVRSSEFIADSSGPHHVQPRALKIS